LASLSLSRPSVLSIPGREAPSPNSGSLITDVHTDEHRRPRFNPWVKKIPWRRKWQSTPVFLPGKFHGQRSLVGYSPWGCKESDKTEGPQFPDRIKPRPTAVKVQSLNHWVAREFPGLLFY